MAISARRWTLSKFAAVLILWAGAVVAAPITYVYTGNSFTSFTGTSNPYTGSDYITGSVTFSNPLPADAAAYTDFKASVISYSFSDGAQTLTNSNSNLIFALFGTTGGAITTWNFITQDAHANEIWVSTDGDTAILFGSGIASNTTAGSWMVAPEPSTWLLMSASLLGLILFRWHRASPTPPS